jgi:hypothetical protein
MMILCEAQVSRAPVQATDPLKVRDCDPELSSVMVRSKEPGTGYHQLS